VEGEAQRRAEDIEQLTAQLGEREVRIAELERAAAERLEALQRVSRVQEEVEGEARRRAEDIERLIGWLHDRDARIVELDKTAADRLMALQYASAQLESSSQQVQCLTEMVRTLQAQAESLRGETSTARGQFDEAECERLRLAALLLALERERLVHFLLRRLRKRPASSIVAE
jgi:chromosome segregation ATPase